MEFVLGKYPILINKKETELFNHETIRIFEERESY